jgi:hypothetical protein
VTKKEEKEQIKYENYWTFIYDVRKRRMLRCPVPGCGFENVFQDSMDHHWQYTHIPNHPIPPNEVLHKMTSRDTEIWKDIQDHRS